MKTEVLLSFKVEYADLASLERFLTMLMGNIAMETQEKVECAYLNKGFVVASANLVSMV
jgi:hypothetical protein